MKKILSALMLSSAVGVASPQATEMELSVATRTPFATVVSSSGIGTDKAEAVAKFTDKSKRNQCEGYNSNDKDIRECIGEWDRNLSKVVSASANCPDGILFFSGSRYEYVGTWPDLIDGRKLTKWKGPNAKIVPDGMASEAYPLDQNWSTLCPGVVPKRIKSPENSRSVVLPLTSDKTSTVKAGKVSGRPWMHNGSEIAQYEIAGSSSGRPLYELAYNKPKASIRSVVRPGAILFRGDLADGRISGTAYAFKDGCEPAPYPVKGRYSNHMYTLTLVGAGPVRKGCQVVSYSDLSPHSILKFSYLLND
jgi:hypothetical protein